MRLSPPPRWTAALLACAAFTAAAHASAQDKARDPDTLEAERLTRELVASRGSLLGLGAAAELVQHIPALADRDALRLLNDAARARLHPHAAALIDRERARFALDHGDRAQANAILQQRGFILTWHLLGPFPNEGMSAFGVDLPPEAAFDPQATADTRVGPARWTPLQDRHHLGDIDAEALIRPTENAAVLLATTLDLPRDARVVLHATASTPYRLLVDGRELAAVSEDPGGLLDRDAWGVELKRGRHTLLVKLANEAGESRFNLRVTDPAGLPIKGLAARPELLPTPAADAAPVTFDVATPLKDFTQAARSLDPRKPEPRALALARAALLARVYRPDDIAEPAVELLREARATAETPHVLRIAAQHDTEHWRRQDAIDRALRLAPQDPLVHLLRAQIAREGAGDAHRAEILDILHQLQQDHPAFIAPRLLHIQLLTEEERNLEALRLALDLAKQHPDHPAVLAAALQISAELPLLNHERDLYARRLTLDADNFALYGPYAALLLRDGETDAARQIVQRALALRPDITGFYGLVADVERAAGDLPRAEAALRQLVALVPGDAGYWSRLGIFLLETDDRDEGLQALQRSLELQPQNADLKAYVQHLTPNTERLQDRYALPLPTPSAEDLKKYSGEDLIELLDQTVTRVFPNGLTSTFHQRAWRVLNTSGAEKLRYFTFTYTPGSENPTLHKVRVTKPDGATSETYQTVEQSVSEPQYNLHYDVRGVVVLLPNVAPGDQVEILYSIDQTASTNIFGDYFGDLWFAQSAWPRLLGRYVLITPDQRDLAIREPQAQHTSQTIALDGAPAVERTWTVHNAPPVPDEPGAPGVSELADYLHISSFTSVEALGRWYWNLIKDQLVMDAEMKEVVKNVTQGLSDRRQIVSAIANWIVQNTRYVGLEFGIHGFKPYRTTLCFRRRFGDCKDKASLIKVMLEEAGIPANIVLIRTRRNGAIDPQPASLQIFDHAIAYVPEFDLFIDGTAEFSGTRELPWGDQDAQVIIVQDGGGTIARRTPVRPASTNLTTTTLHADLTASPQRVQGEATLSGSFAGAWRERYQTPETRSELYTRAIHEHFAGARLTRFDLSDLARLEEPVQARWAFEGARLTLSDAPDELRLLPALRPARFVERLASRPERTTILEIGHPFTLQDTVHFKLPQGFALTSPRPPVQLDAEFGAFAAQLQPTPDGATFAWTLRIDAWRVTPDKYPAFRRWLAQIDEALETPLVFKKQNK